MSYTVAMLLTFIILLLGFTTIPKQLHPANQVLEEYDIHLNLVPKGATTYKLNKDTGEFEVYMGSKTCKLTVDGYDFMFKSTITGVISSKKLSKLKGVSVMANCFRLDVHEFTIDDNCLGVSSRKSLIKYSSEEEKYENLPKCGCGFGCKGFDFFQEKMKMVNLTKLLNWSL